MSVLGKEYYKMCNIYAVQLPINRFNGRRFFISYWEKCQLSPALVKTILARFVQCCKMRKGIRFKPVETVDIQI